jgi:hypothetical protein
LRNLYPGQGNPFLPKMFKNVEDLLKKASQPITEPFPSVAARKEAKILNKTNYSNDPWTSMKGTKITPELEKDLKLLSLRNALDLSRHYKAGEKIGGKDKPFQVGTIIESSNEFYSGRLTKKQRKPTLVDTLMYDEEKRSVYKNKFLSLQRKHQSGSLKNYRNSRQTRLQPHKKDAKIKYEKKK